MNHATPPDSARAIASRMESQRAQLHRQFLTPPPPDLPAPADAPTAAIQPFAPRSLTMKLLMANPQLLQRAALLAVTTVLGARYSSWAVRLFGLALSLRARP